jgi:hypothetical protein
MNSQNDPSQALNPPSKELWCDVVTRLWPEADCDEAEGLALVLYDMVFRAVEAHQQNDEDELSKIYAFAEWCRAQEQVDPIHIGDIAVTAFYEHLVDHEITYHEIPKRIKPTLFADLLGVFEYRLDDLPRRYPMKRPGTFAELVAEYDKKNNTNFSQQVGR